MERTDNISAVNLSSGDVDVGAAVGLPMSPLARRAVVARLGDFYELTKPRMNFLVIITTMVGFYLASRGPGVAWQLLLHTLLGTALTAASASVLNQWMERRYDALMPRTRNRPLPGGRLTPGEALSFGIPLGVVGVAYLAVMVNPLTAMLGLATLLSYLLIYTPMKRLSPLNTLIGAIPGAIPPMMGYTAVENTISVQAMLLFAVLFIWQMPHFLAIAIMYRDDYAAGGFKMLPVVDRSLQVTGRMIVLYCVALLPVSVMAVPLGISGYWYLVVAVLLGLGFLFAGVRAAQTRARVEARKLFFASIIYLPLLLAAMLLNAR